MRRGINGEKRERSSENEQENTESGGEEREPCLTLISQSVAHPPAEDAFVTMTDPCCLCAARRQHHYRTLLMYTQKHTEERETYLGREHMQW